MALGKYSRVDGRRTSSNYCSTVTIIGFVAICLVGVWMMSSSSLVPGHSEDIKNQVRDEVSESNVNDKPKEYEDSPGDLPEDATRGVDNASVTKNEGRPNDQDNVTDNATDNNHETKPVDRIEDLKKNSNDESKNETENVNMKTRDIDTKMSKDNKSNANEGEKEPDSTESEKLDSNDNEKKSHEKSAATKYEDKVDRQVENEQQYQDDPKQNSGDIKDGEAQKEISNEVFSSGARTEISNETTIQNGSWSTQAAESKNEKEIQQSAESKQQIGHTWKLCNIDTGPDYIPCLDNLKAIVKLRSTKHYEHRERHCPKVSPTCLVPLPEGYKRPIQWPTSRDKVWYSNVPHTKLAEVKGHQNWVKVTGEYLTFPGGGTQFKNGALHYIEFIEKTVPDIAWGKRTRVVLDVGCGVASFGGYLFEKNVITMSFAPKDEHEAQVQFALERGIPAISAVMGTKRLPFPGSVFDVVHCARCRVPWHIEGGKLLLELNRVLRPGGFFVWSATPVYQKLGEDVEIWNAMEELTKSMCWQLVAINKDKLNEVGAAIYQKPTSNDCYEQRSKNTPPFCQESDDPNAAWNVALQLCLHKASVNDSERGSKWPEQWPARVQKVPYWLTSSEVGVYGKPAPEDFASDSAHWQHVVKKSYLNGMGFDWSNVRNVMDMRSVYGGFAAALKNVNVWVMNVVSVDSADTLPIIYERGLFGMYHDWCESFNTYPRSYDLLHADHLFSLVKKKCHFVGLVAEADRILRPEGRLIIRDTVETISEVENMLKSLHWENRLIYTKDKEGILCVQKSKWRPAEFDASD